MIVKIIPTIKHYAWGASAQSSLVSRLARYKGEDPCAELWFGVHPLGESTLVHGGTLSHFLNERNLELPYLFKVLSVGSPLSIQLHPTLGRAKSLHKENPKEYPDENHKPEIAIALNQLDVVAGLKSDEDFSLTLNTYEGLRVFKSATTSKDALKKLYFLQPHEVSAIVNSLRMHIDVDAPIGVEKYFLQACSLYDSHDPGLVALFLLQFKTLLPGQGIFTGPGIPHAYLSGNIIECMANSDNVVRGGLTKKFLDKDVFLEIVSSENSDVITPNHEPRFIYAKNDIREFKVIRFENGSFKEDFPSPSIILCIEASLSINGDELRAGEAAFIMGLGYDLMVTGQAFVATVG